MARVTTFDSIATSSGHARAHEALSRQPALNRRMRSSVSDR
jgi:hypothetical protein